MEKIQKIWDSLPKECKVGAYLIASGLIGMAIPYVQGLSIKSESIQGMLLLAVSNILLVILVEAKKRIDLKK